MGFSLKSIVSAVTAPITAPIKAAEAAVSVIKGESISSAGKQLISAQASTSPVGQIETAAQTNLTGFGGLAAGDVSGDNLKKAAITTAAAGGVALGGPAVGATIFGAGNQLAGGNLKGAALTAANGLGAESYLKGLVPESLQPYASQLSGFFKSGTAGTGPAITSEGLPVANEEGGKAGPIMLAIAGGILLLVIIKKRRKK